MSSEQLVFYVLGTALVVYALTGGADYGGGVWDLFASGPRRREQRSVIEHAIAPIWEANHVWLILIVVLVFTCFPRAFAVIGSALHIPLFAALIGIVLRGAAFTFRAYGLEPLPAKERWGRIFAWSSLLTPIALGMCLAGVASGHIRVTEKGVVSGFFAGWSSVFAVLVGLFAASLCALLAAVYLTVESDGQVQEDFRKRALGAALAVLPLGGGVIFSAVDDAPWFAANLLHAGWSRLLQAAAGLSWAFILSALWLRYFTVARAAAALHVAAVVAGFGLALEGRLVVPDLNLYNAGARPEVLSKVLWTLALGGLVLLPALWYLMRVFKGARS